MKRLVISCILAVAALVTVSAHAAGLKSDSVQSAGFDQLTEAQKAEVLKTVADKVEATKAGESAASLVAEPQRVGEWIDVGTKIGQMMGGAAKEVGVAVNDFVKTPVGQWTMAIVIWKFMGGPLMHVFGAVMILVVGIGFIGYFARKYTGVTIEYDQEKKDMFGRAVKKVVRRKAWDGEDTGWFMVSSAIVILAALIALFTY